MYRGPLRALRAHGFVNDFLPPAIQSHAWILGKDPYDPLIFTQLWPSDAGQIVLLHREALDGSMPAKRGMPSPYPLPCFPLLFPLGLIRWKIANLLWIAICLFAFALALICTAVNAGIDLRTSQAGVLAAGALAFAPFHTAIFTENPVLPVFALGMLAMVIAERGKEAAAIVLLIVALAFKPTVALPFVGYLLIRDRWRILIPVVMGVGLLLAVGQIRLTAAGASWLPTFLRGSQKMFGPGGIDDFSSVNPLRFNLLNLQVIGFELLGTRLGAQVAAWLTYLVLLTLWLWGRRRTSGQAAGVLELSILAATILLPFYHRFYDAVLLLLPLSWAIGNFRGELRRYARVALLLMTPFLLPGATVLNQLAGTATSFKNISRFWWWNLFVVPHEIWAVLLLSVVLIAARRKMRVPATEPVTG